MNDIRNESNHLTESGLMKCINISARVEGRGKLCERTKEREREFSVEGE